MTLSYFRGVEDAEWQEARDEIFHAKHLAEQQGYEDARHGVNAPDRAWPKDYERGRARYFEEGE